MFTRLHLKCAVYVVASILIVISLSGSTPASAMEYTLDADFDLGSLAGVEHDTVHDQLQLSEQQVTLPFIWVANSGESTVSKIDTETGEELGRYRTGPGTGSGEDPSRTTVDIYGNLWVGNRNSSTAVKISLYPTDTTGGEASPRGNIFTPADSTPDGILNTSTGPSDVKPWGQDDAVVMRIAVDSGPRALAVDALNNVWIGGYGQNMGYYDGDTGAKLKNIYVGRSCYGALVDGNGTLWISNQNYNSLTRIDNPSGTHTMTFIGANGFVYGIGIDSSGYIYTAGYNSNQLRKYDPVAGGWVYQVWIPGGSLGRGVCVGLDGDVWVAQSGNSRVTRHNGVTGALIATIGVGATPTGVAVDAAGKIWVTNYGSHSIMRIDPATNLIDFTQGGHTYPYNYSDMTGIISRTITTKTGTWTVDYDSGMTGTPWGTISWNSSEPSGTSVIVQARSSTDGSSWGSWEAATNGADLTAIADGRYIQVEVTLQITDGDVSPILYDLTILPECDPIAIESLDADPMVVPIGADVYFSSVLSGCYVESCLWTFDDGATDDSNPYEALHSYSEPGVYTVGLNVSDGPNTDYEEVVVVAYDPSAGFVTGGGWIDSPAGAYKPDPGITGKANFGFVSRYKKGATAPTGQTEFVFQTADLNFHSDSYEWLVVTQGGSNAQFKGKGTINLYGPYKFMIWAGDDSPDTFRIRIWEENEVTGEETDIYDNGDPPQAIGAGSIVIHTK